MRFITAKFNSQCHETGAKIKKGDSILYDPNIKKVYCKGSTTYQARQSKEQSEFEQAGRMAADEQDAYFDNWCQQNGI